LVVGLVVGCWLLVAGCWLLVAGCWLLVAGCWLLVAGCWLLVVAITVRATLFIQYFSNSLMIRANYLIIPPNY
jgi:hypothetical protein